MTPAWLHITLMPQTLISKPSVIINQVVHMFWCGIFTI